MTTFSDSILFIANGITQQSHSGDTISISRNLTIASPSTFSVGVNLNFTSGFAPSIVQTTAAGTGANAGAAFTVQSQAGQNVASGTNNNGGNLILNAGAHGTGGSGGFDGYVILETGGSAQLTVSSGAVTINSLAGSGAGLVAVDNSGNLSFTSLGGDLTGTANDAVVQQLTGVNSSSAAIVLIPQPSLTETNGWSLQTDSITNSDTDSQGFLYFQRLNDSTSGEQTFVGLGSQSDGYQSTSPGHSTQSVTDVYSSSRDHTGNTMFSTMETLIQMTDTSRTGYMYLALGDGYSGSPQFGGLEIERTNITDMLVTLSGYTVQVGTGPFTDTGFTAANTINLATNSANRLTINNSGVVAISNLSGSGSGYVAVDNSGNLSFSAGSSGISALTGDVTASGTGSVAATVVRIQNNPVAAQTLNSSTDGYVLTWDNADGYWKAEPGSSISVVTLSGDVTGNSNSNTVVSLSGASNEVIVNAINLVWQNGVSLPEISQLNLASGNSSTAGQPFSIIPQNGQNALSGTTNGGNGGNLLLSSGIGGTPSGSGTAGTSGNIQLQLGASTLITYTTNFETWAATATPTITQASTSTGSGSSFTVQAQNATGATNNGGNLVLAGGTSGSATAGNVQLQTAGTTRLTAGATGVITIANLSTGVVHADSSGNLTSSPVNLASADVTGVLPAANQAAQTMGGDVTGTTATNTVIKINGTSVSASPSSAQILIAQSSTSSLWETVSQDATIATTGAITVVSANGNFLVNGTTTATTGILTNSIDTITGTTLNLGTSTATKVQIGKSGNLTEILGDLKVDGAETIVGTSTFQAAVAFDGNVTVADGYSFTVTGTTAGNYSINGATASSLSTNSGASLTITAGAASTWSTTAGTLTLNGNTGVNLQTGGTTIASTNTNQFVFSKGIRRNVRTVTAGTAITATDDIISVGTLSGLATMTLPTSPTVGDAYTIKDKVGGAATNSITLDSGSGNKIDASQTFVIDVNYAAVDVVCLATSPVQWGIM